MNTPAALSEDVSQRGEMNGGRWKAVVGGIRAFFFVTDNQRASALWLSALTAIDAIKLPASRQQSTGRL